MSVTATYKIEVSWSGQQTGVFTIGTSTLGGTDVLSGDFGYTVFDDITSEVKTCRIRRGRADDLLPMNAGECTLKLNDPNGKYNSTNPASALAGMLVPLRPVRIKATYGGTVYGIFQGFVRRIETNSERDIQEATIEATDLFVWLDRAYPIIAATGPTTTGAAIGKVLDSIAFTDTALRDIDTGDTLADFSADGSLSGLAIIAALLTAERGVFYVSKNGVATYEDRHARGHSPRDAAQTTIAGTMSAIAPGVDLDQIRNRARVTRVGGVQQTAVDEASRYAYGFSDYVPITTPYLSTDDRALSLAKWMVVQRKDPRPPVRYLNLVNRDAPTFVAMLTRDLNDRIAASETVGGTSGDFHIEGTEDLIEDAGTLHRTRWILSKRGIEAFVIGVSKFGGLDVLTY